MLLVLESTAKAGRQHFPGSFGQATSSSLYIRMSPAGLGSSEGWFPLLIRERAGQLSAGHFPFGN